MKRLVTVVRSVCVRDKEHLILGGAYGASAIWHHSAILTLAYSVAALLGLHIIRRSDRVKRNDRNHAVYHGRHLADD